MKKSSRKQFIFLVVIVFLLLIFSPKIFSSITDAQIQPEKSVSHEDQVKIYGDEVITIHANDSFHPNQYYKAVDDAFQLVQMSYTSIDTSKPGRHPLTLIASNKKDTDKRTVLIVVEKEKKTENKTQRHSTPASTSRTETSTRPAESSTAQSSTRLKPAIEEPQISTESTQDIIIPQPENSNAADDPPQAPPIIVEEAVEAPISQQDVLPPNQLSFLGYSLPYQNAGQGAGQSIINAGELAATWGGSPVQSGTDNQNTHFIGHNPGVFSSILALSIGNTITVTDSAGHAATYSVTNVIQVDDSGRDIHSGQDNWDQITSTSGGERITLQTCLGDTVNLIVFAQA